MDYMKSFFYEEKKVEPVEDFNPHHHRDYTGSTSYLETFIHLLKSSLGAGVLAMPLAYKSVGIVGALIGIPTIAFLCGYCVHLLIYAQYKLCQRERIGYISFPEALSKSARTGPPCLRCLQKVLPKVVNYFLVIWHLGVSAIYIIFVSAASARLAELFDVYFAPRLWMTIYFAILLPLNLIKSYKMLVWVSALANILTFVAFIFLFTYLFDGQIGSDYKFVHEKSILAIPQFIGYTLSAIESIGVIIALEKITKVPHKYVGWCGILCFGLTLIAVIYMLVGLAGYLKYGDAVQASITFSLPQNEWRSICTQVLIVMTIFLSYPLQNIVAYEVIFDYIKSRHLNMSSKKIITVDWILRILSTVIPYLEALAVPQLGPALSLFGALCLSVLGIVLPTLVDLMTIYPQYGPCNILLLRDVFIIFIGFFCLFTGVLSSLHDIVETYT